MQSSYGKSSLARRALLPRILAVLATGAVTLGALPCASAALVQKTDVTEDLVVPSEDSSPLQGIAGSVNGVPASVSVGTEGGGETPRLRNTKGKSVRVYGTHLVSEELDRQLYLSGSRVTIKSGSMSSVFGASVSLNNGGVANIRDVHVTLAGGTTEGWISGVHEYVRSGSVEGTAEKGIAENNTVKISGGERKSTSDGVFGAWVVVGSKRDAVAKANRNALEYTAGMDSSELYGAYVQTLADHSLEAEANANQLTIKASGGHFYGGYIEGIQQNGAAVHGSAAANENVVKIQEGSGVVLGRCIGGYSKLIGKYAQAPLSEAHKNQIIIENGAFGAQNAIDGNVLSGGYSLLLNENASSIYATLAKAYENRITVEKGVFRHQLWGGCAFVQIASGRGVALSRENVVELHDGAYQGTICGGIASAYGKSSVIPIAEATKNKIKIQGGAYENRIYGGRAQVKEISGARATAAENILELHGGTYTKNLYGGVAKIAEKGQSHSKMTLVAEKNRIFLQGGAYAGEIVAGAAFGDDSHQDVEAIVRENALEIQGSPDLSKATLFGAQLKGGRKVMAGNALVVKNTKGIRTARIEAFQKLDFYIPADMTEKDVMLIVTSDADTDLKNAAITAYLSNNIAADQLHLLHTEQAKILTDDQTKMSVNYSDLATEKREIRITKDQKDLILKKPSAPKPPKPPKPGQAEEPLKPEAHDAQSLRMENNRKSLSETVAGTVAFLGEGADLFTGAGMESASVEAAASMQTFAPFAAVGGASMRYNTGSHVNMKGMNLSVGFSREVLRGADRLVFGPIVEYGRGSYDSYVGETHGDGSVRTLGIGGFLRWEKADGAFYEGSLRFGRAYMKYAANLPTPTSYDTSAGYIGAHLGFGRRVVEENGTERELYARYHYTRQNGASAILSTGYRNDFDAVESHRLRTGARWKFPQKGGALLLGASIQYEFGGEANATLHAGGTSYTTPAPSLRGFSGSMEFGWNTRLSERAALDLGVEGWLGKQSGMTFKAGLDWKL